MRRTTAVMGFSVPRSVAKEVSSMARQERRTKSELFREMVRIYRRYRTERDRDEDRWIRKLIDEAKAEQETNPMSVDEMLKESELLARYGAKQAKKLGIKPKDLNRLIHEHRRARQA